ncbi:type 1 fimbrial protein [Salmonella enterica subsp. enterica]|nr:type 1 fimbrial protein [Salmonella enterica subsp. enterica serovar Bonn]EBZ5939328.1 type 1 fimbrial protein [Salmonella enterica subsp. enterica serovar Muenchen]MLZ41071.1 type 1 fimbrial protein [Salmonella enterica subsp. enterica serovar Bonn]
MKNRKDIIASLLLMAVSLGAYAAPQTGMVHFSGRITAPACDTSGINSQNLKSGSVLCWHQGKQVKTDVVRGANGEFASKPPQISDIHQIKVNGNVRYTVFNYN